MKLAFDAKRLFHNKTGLGNYSRSLVKEIKLESPDSDLYLLTPSIENTPFNDFLKNDYKLCLGKGKFLWRLKHMTRDLDMIKPDIYHGLSNELPVGIEKLNSIKSIVTIHDLIFLRFPNFYPLADRILYREKSGRACKKAKHIVAISEATKKDIVHFFGIDPGKISVIYQGASHQFYKPYEVRLHDESKRPYFLFVSSISKRKNLATVVRALGALPREKQILLKVVGQGGKYEKKMRQLVADLGLDKSVEFLGGVSDADLMILYENALASIYPSLMEGFGIPIVESLLLGTPVITSDRSSMPEAADGLATLVDPNSIEEMKNAILHHFEAPRRLSVKEVDQIRSKFHPKRQAKEVLQLYSKLIAE